MGAYFDDVPAGGHYSYSIAFSLSLFVDASGVLSACFEAKLIEPAAPEAGCVVC